MRDDGRGPLTDWVPVYRELCEAERLLAQANPADATELRARVERLSLELDEALGEVRQVLEDGKAARGAEAARSSPADRCSQDDGVSDPPARPTSSPPPES